MRHFLPTTALLCAVFLSACSGESDGPNTEVVEAAIEQEIDRLIGDATLVNLDGITLGEAMAQGSNLVRFDATWTGTVVVEGPLYKMNPAEMFGAEPFVTVSSTNMEGKSVQVKGEIGYVLREGAWVADKKPRILLEDGNELVALGTSLAFASNNGQHPLAGTPEAANKRAAMASNAAVEADTKAANIERSQNYRAQREAELKALVEERRLRKAEEARKAQEAEGATQP
jgi:hypothetical protein